MDAPHHRARRGFPLKADPAHQRRLLDLQALDTKLDQLTHRRKSLPEIADLEKLAGEHSRLRDAEVSANTQVSDLERQRERADKDVELVRARKDRDQRRLDTGQVSAARELESLQSEIASLDRRQSELEEIELEIMEKLEAAEEEASRLAVEREDVGRRARDVQANRDAAWQEIDAELTERKAERDAVAGEIPDDLLGLYEKTRAAGHGIGAAAIRQRRCEGCRLELDPVTLNTIRSAAPDAIVRCEECRRILVRTDESGL
ncbi:MAG TPA: C4-type zinc ribbon domain-containing protein [Jiangellaceae bacterium]